MKGFVMIRLVGSIVKVATQVQFRPGLRPEDRSCHPGTLSDQAFQLRERSDFWSRYVAGRNDHRR